MGKRQQNIAELLGTGKDQARTTKELVALLQISPRELAKQVHAERVAGAPILSTTYNGGGYYLSNDCEELREYIKAMEHRKKELTSSIRPAKRLLETLK